MSIALDKLNNAELERFIHLQATIARQGDEAARTIALREYYAGDHPTMLTTRMQEYLGPIVHGDAFPFAHNLVRSVIDTLTERLSVEGFSVNGVALTDLEEGATPDENGAMAALLWQWWKGNRADLKEQKVYTAALRDGAAFVMVDYNPATQRPRLTIHNIDDGTSGVRIHRDPSDEDTVLFATRYFWEQGADGKTVERKTVYLPGEIRKYRRDGAAAGGWAQVQDAGDPAWPLAWRDVTGQPLGVAVVEFANPDGAECAQIIGLQNLLNKSWLDLIAAADASGFPLLVAEYESGGGPIGGGADDDNLEGSDENRIGPGRMFEIEGGTIRRLEAANLLPMLETIWATVEAIGGVSRTPQYYLRPVGGGDVPSGEALKQLESGLVARAVKRQRIFGQAWEDVLHLALRVYAAFGPGVAGAGDEPTIEVQWADAWTRNETAQAQIAEAHKRLNVPDPFVWAQLGYSPDEIAQFQRTVQADQAQKMAAIATALRTQQPTAGQGNGAQAATFSANGNGATP